MSESDQIPQYLIDGLVRFTNAFYAHAANSMQTFFPLELKCHLYPEGSWQQSALENLFRTTFKDVSPSRMKGKSPEYTWGFAMGIFESISSLDDDETMDKFLPSTYVGEKISEVDPEQAATATNAFETYYESFNSKQEKEFTRGKLCGLESVYDEMGQAKYESYRTDIYMLMLIMEDQLKFLDSWRSFHEFVGFVIEGYQGANRFEACKKAARAVGFSPSKQIQISCQTGGTSTI